MGKIRKNNKVKDGTLSTFDGFEGSEVARKWFENSFFEAVEKLEKLSDVDDLSESKMKELKMEAQKALENESLLTSNRSTRAPGKSNYEWLKTIMTKGTVSDRIAANIVMIQNSPIHNLATLRNLISMVKVGKKKECITVIETLSELFLMDLLIPDQKLRTFENFPLAAVVGLNGPSRSSKLILWYFEDQLKELYRAFIQALQMAAQDSVEINKEKAITAMSKLLTGNPEQESLLLTCIVNKLGDPSPKIASKTIHCLTRLLHQHPNMKSVVMQEIEKLLFRPNVSSRAQYYGICFLTLFILSREDVELAVSLINLYFSFFKACLKKGNIDTRLMSALLTGVNRAYPFAKEKLVGIEDQIETVYKVVHIASFNISVHALRLLYQVADYTSAVSDRFYSALYKKLSDPTFNSSSHQAMFLNLVFRALKKDASDSRVKAFIKRILQICLYMPVPLVCGILYMVSQLVQNNKALLAVTVKACSFSLLGNLDEDDDEHYEDVKVEDSEGTLSVMDGETVHKTEDAVMDEQEVEDKPVTATWFHCQNLQGKSAKSSALGQYDPYQRNPLFAGGDFCAYTELVDLCNHYHPTVSLFARKLLEGEKISYSGDPMQDFTLARFLDRFVFKNPKKQANQTDKPNSKLSRKSNYQPRGIKSLAVNSANYLNSDESTIPVDELFMYKYLSKKKATKAEIGEDDESDVDSVGSEEFEDMLDDLMGGKEKEIDYADEVGDKLTVSNNLDFRDDSEGEASNKSEDYGSGDELDDDSAEDIVFDDDDDDDEDIEFDINNLPDDDNDDIFEDNGRDSKGNNGKKGKSFLKGGISRSVFASADEFAEMLEDAGDSNIKLGGLAAMSNKDKAGMKQLKWEMTRNHWLKGPKQRKRKGQSSPRPRKKFKL